MPVNVEPRYDIADIGDDLARVYADFPGLGADGCLGEIRESLAGDGVFYAGWFNGKAVAGALVSGPSDARRIRMIAVRPVTRGRGVSLRLVDEIGRLEHLAGASALEVSPAEAARPVLTRLGFAPSGEGRMRKPLSAG